MSLENLAVAEESREQMYRLVSDLYPICRSITGDGIRKTLAMVKAYIPLDIHEVPSGTKVFDWNVPREWNIRDAYVKDSAGNRVIDFHASNLHVVNYSVPIHRKMSLADLRPHLHTLAEHPEWIPYRTSYYKEDWGFCLAHRKLQSLKEGEYEVCIDSSLEDGHLTYGEYFIRGTKPDEVLISCHACHPSLCNDNLSGVALSTFLARILSGRSLRLSYRFVFVPGTIGAITWLSRNQESTSRIRHGLVVACVGDPGKLHYKKSRRGDSDIDRAVQHVLKHGGGEYEVRDFSPLGYDERQYCSPGFDLPVGSLTRTPNGRYEQYHTSADDLQFVRPEFLSDSLSKYLSVVSILESNKRYLGLNLHCEPQLGKRGLYSAIGGRTDQAAIEVAMLWVLNLSDGSNSVLDIADRSGLEFGLVGRAVETLVTHRLLRECEDGE